MQVQQLAPCLACYAQGYSKTGEKCSPPSLRMPRDPQLHPTFPDYPRWALDKLAGKVARDAPNAVVYIVANWMEEHREALRDWGITPEQWLREKADEERGSG